MKIEQLDQEPVIGEAALAALQLPPLEAWTLPPSAYWSEEAYRAELEHIFYKEWTCIGRVEDMPEVGDFSTHAIATESVIVVHDSENQLRAHLNVCRHRGCQLVSGSGKTKAFRCPYHGWMYALNGELRGAPDFKETVGFSKKDFSLHPVQLEIWEGFVLVNLDSTAGPFHERVSDVKLWGLQHYGIDTQITTHRWRYELDCNWKTYVENYIEEYHVPWVHSDTLQPLTPMKSHVEFPELSPQQWDIVVAQSPGMTLSDSGDALFPVSPDIGKISPEFLGLPIWMCYPAFGVIPMLDCTLYYNLLPLGPESCELRIGMTLPATAAAALEDEDQRAVAAAEEYERNVESFVKQDNDICVRQQLGLRSLKAGSGRFCKHEGLAWKFDNWVARTAYSPNGRATPSD